MALGSPGWLPRNAALSGLVVLALTGLSARAQYPSGYGGAGQPSPFPLTPYQGPGCPFPPPSAGMMPPGPAATYPGPQPPPGLQQPGGRIYPAAPYQPYIPPQPCLPGMIPPGTAQPAQPGQPSQPGGQQPGQPGGQQPGQPGTTPPGQQPSGTPETQTPTDPGTGANQESQADTGNADTGQDSALGGEQGAAGGGSAVAFAAPGGYLDIPIPITTFRIRYDSAYNINRPDRAEYIYGAWKELGFHQHGIQGPGHGTFFDPKARGPEQIAQNVDYQQPSAYFEVAARNRVSAFLEAPYRYIHFRGLQEDGDLNSEQKLSRFHQPNAGPNQSNQFFPEPGPENTPQPTRFNGFSDLQFGFKWALVADPYQFLTFMLRGYSPTGSSGMGLGTGHWSVEPGLLFYERFNRLVLQGQITDWVPIHGGEAGNILTYGFGVGYAVFQRGNFVIMPVNEYLGWTVLNGYQSVVQPMNVTSPDPNLELPRTHGVAEAGGNTIINAKFGVRAFWGNGQSLYVGYGRALTGTHWYTDIFRIEYRIFFGAGRLNARAL